MNKYVFPVIAIFAMLLNKGALAQNPKPLKQGRVMYEQLIKGGTTNVTINGTPQSFTHPDRTMKWELLFSENESLRRFIEADERPEVEMAGSAGVTGSLRMVSSLMSESTIWHHFPSGRKVDQRETAGKKYLVEDSIVKHTWKLTGETRTILGYTCQKAITQTPMKSSKMQMQNGEFKRTETWDTVNVIAWFAPALAVPAGPELQGELPGLILEYESRNGAILIKAVEVSETVKLADIKEPKTGKKVTRAEFDLEVENQRKEMMERMRSTRGASF